MKSLARPLPARPTGGRGLASRFPSVQMMAKIAKALGVNIEDLIK